MWAVALSLVAYLAFYGVTFWFAGRTLARELGHGAREEPAHASRPPSTATSR